MLIWNEPNGARRPDAMTDRPEASDAGSPVVDPGEVSVCPASPGQQGLWFIDRLQPGNPTYNIPVALDLDGPVDWQLFQRCLDVLVERHEILRASFALIDDRPSMVVSDALSVRLALHDLTHIEDRESAVTRLTREEAQRPFDLATTPLLRVTGITQAPTRHRLVIVVHHIVADAWSVAILVGEMAALYRAFASGNGNPLPPLDLQYPDYCAWLDERLTPPLVARQIEYWRQTLGDAPEPAELPGDRPRPAAATSRGGSLAFTVDARTSSQLLQFARAEGATTFMVLVALVNMLVSKYTGADDVTIGTPTAGRPRPELETIVGYFVNTLALRTSLGGDPSLRTTAGRVRRGSLDAFHHQDVPFSSVVEAVRPERSGRHQPIFSTMCVMFHVPPGRLDFGPVEARGVAVHNGTTKFEWLWEFRERDGLIEGTLEFSDDRFSPAAAGRAIAHFLHLMSAALAAPDAPLSSLDLLTDTERARIREWNETRVERPLASTVLAGFARQVDAAPESIAVQDGDRALSYRALDARAHRLARLLRARGAGPGTRVGILMNRSADLLVAILATMRSGAAYVPLDPSYPVERLKLMAADADLHVVLGDAHAESAGVIAADRLVNATAIGEAAEDVDARVDVEITGDMPCYVMYTSGSTGRPKGVVMPHGVLANLVAWQLERSAPRLTTLQYGSPSFDVSFQEIFATWLGGGRLVVVAEPVRRDPFALLDLIDAEQVARLFVPFVALEMLADAAARRAAPPQSLREIVTAGEQLRISGPVRRFFEGLPDCRLDNQYGPTESHVITAHRLEGDATAWPELPPIGRPIANARVHVLDSGRRQVPIGVPGDIWLGGACLAQGYWGQPTLTAERFKAVVIDGVEERLYASGDRGRYLPDGSIEFLGRGDDQVKIRGFRVEPGEIEAAMQRLAGVRQAAVVARRRGGVPQLVAYYVSDGGTVSPEMLRETLRHQLPDYMVPAGFIPLDHLPTTPSGKVDRRRLPDVPSELTTREREAPGTDTERTLHGIWSAVLGVTEIGVTDNFFDVGGHSLAALRVFSQIESSLGLSLPLSALFSAPTIRELARTVDEQRDSTASARRWPAVVPVTVAPGPPLVCVHSLSGDILEYRDLARVLGPAQPLLGVQATLDADLDAVYGSIEATAAFYLDELRKVQPSGPYYLCGWSSGGVVVLEMAQQLLAGGEQVGLLAIVDTAPHVDFSVRRPWYQRIPMLLANIPGWIRDDVMVAPKGDLMNRVRHRVAIFRRRMRSPNERTVEVRDVVNFPKRTGAWEQFVQLHFRAMQAYRARFYPGRVSLFRAPTHPLLWLHEPERIWRHMAAETDVYMTSGTHFSIVKDPHVQVLADAIRRAMARSTSHGGPGPDKTLHGSAMTDTSARNR